ncbi:MAG: hypothetical protein ACRDIY_15250 [Chloroflexota bacterium]
MKLGVAMKNFARGIGFLVLSLVIGEIIKKLLTSRLGRTVLGRAGHPELATLEGANEASKKVKQGVDLARSLTREEQPAAPRERASVGPRWARIARDASEMLLATGGLLRAVSDFVHEDEQLRKRFEKIGARID